MNDAPGTPWPFGADRAADGFHRAVHVFSLHWARRTLSGAEVPATWQEAEALRALAVEHRGCPLADAFVGHGHLERQYARVRNRMPTVIGRPMHVVVPHRVGEHMHDVHGELLLVRLAAGHLLLCVSLRLDLPLEALPEAFIAALEQGPNLELRAGDDGPTTLEAALHRVARSVDALDSATRAPDAPLLLLGSELHTILFVREGDETRVEDPELVQRLLGRVPDRVETRKDPAIQWPGEFNRWARTMGAVRPGASVLAGHGEAVAKNVLVSACLLVGSAALLREARDEAYEVLNEVNDMLAAPRHRWSLRGVAPFEVEQNRLAVATIAVAFQVETHLDIRRVVSDAYIADFHRVLSEALSIRRSVDATIAVAARLEAAIASFSARSAARNGFVLTFAVGGLIGLTTLAVDLLK